MIAIQRGGDAPELTPSLKAAVTADLHRWQVQTVIVGPMYNQAAMVKFFVSLLNRAPQPMEGVLVWWDVQI